MTIEQLIEILAKIAYVLAMTAGVVGPIVWLERKWAAWVQERTGPNVVGPWGLFQPLIDVVKFVFKEDVTPGNAHKVLFTLAPCLEVFTAIIATATIPFGNTLTVYGREVKLVIADLDVGILWVFAIGSLAVYGILLAGWASSNHYSFLGGLRSSAQIISYELGMTLAVVGVLLFSGSLRLREIVMAQGPYMWNFWVQPIGFVVFFVAIFAETNRNPFDLPEAESELVAGYHTEYGSMRFAMFFMAEYIAMITMSSLLVTLYLGGWNLPFYETDGILSMVVFAAKVAMIMVCFIHVRWTLPRMRYDHLMALGWKGILPLAVLQVVASAVKEVFGWGPYAAVLAVIVIGIALFMRTPRTIPVTAAPKVAST